MNRLPQMASVTDFRNNYVQLVEQLDNGPVILAQRSKPVAVVVSPQQWDRMVAELEELRDLVDVLEAEIENAGAEPEAVGRTELQRMAAGDAVPA